MNPKIKKLRQEREKNSQKIATLQQRNRDLDKQIQDLENVDIVGMVRAQGYTLETFSALLKTMKDNPIPQEKEVQPSED